MTKPINIQSDDFKIENKINNDDKNGYCSFERKVDKLREENQLLKETTNKLKKLVESKIKDNTKSIEFVTVQELQEVLKILGEKK